MENSVIGTRAPLRDGQAKITGALRYLQDLNLPGLLHARFVTSIYAHANIHGIDTAAALATPGVVAVVTAQDLPEIEPSSRNRLMLARDRALFAGHPVALVLGLTEAAAEDGASVVNVDYEPLPAAVDMDEAQLPDAPLVWPRGVPGASEDVAAHGAEAPAAEADGGKTGNQAEHVHYSWGDLDAGLAEADVIVDRTFTSPGVHQSYIEPQGYIVQPDAQTGGATVWTSTQGPFSVRKAVAEVLDVPETDVRVTGTPVGGGFGGKSTLYEPLLALAARKVNRPIRLVMTRMEEMQAANPAPAMRVRVRLGVKRDGSFTALDGQLVIDCGIYPFSIVALASMLLGSLYRFPNLYIHGTEVLTFKPSAGAYRAPSAPTAALAIECAIDEACRQLDLDPLQVRIQNAAKAGDPRVSTKKPWPTIGLYQVLEALHNHPAWRERETARAAGRGVGVAVGGWPGGTEPAAAACMLNRDGTLQVHVGTVDLTGTGTSFAMLAAEAFGLPPEAVRIVSSDTSTAPYGGAAGGSKTLYTAGPAVLKAAREARARALEVASSEFEADPADLEIVDGMVRVKGVPDRAIALKELANKTMQFGGKYAPIVGHGTNAEPTQAPGFCAQLAEVEVDRDTGEVRVHRLVMVQDVGRAINPLMIEGQMMGGGMQGLGWALYERLDYEPGGQLLTGSWMDYAVPHSSNGAAKIETVLVEVPAEYGPLGARGVGEPPIIATAAAVANAIADLTGARVTDLPITPARMLAALAKWPSGGMKVQAAVLYEAGAPFQVETLDLDPPRAGEVLVRVAATGVCHSDWHLVTGATKHPMPVVPGHEGAGVVEAVGPGVTRVKIGDHIALNWAPNCGTCFYCLNDRPSLCATYAGPIWAGTMMDGTTRLTRNGQPVYHFSALACFADFTVVPQECCVPLAKAVPLAVAALIGCAVTTGVGAVVNTARVKPGSSVVVYGAGGVGLSIVMGARLAGARRIVVIDRAEGKVDIARDFGASDVMMAGPEVPGAIRDLTEGRGADYVFEAIGIPAVQEQCLDVVRPGGTVVLVGVSAMGSGTNLPGAIITRQEKTVTGSYYGSANTARDFPLYADLYLGGRLDLDRLVSRKYPLEKINEAYQDMLGGDTARGVVVFDAG